MISRAEAAKLGQEAFAIIRAGRYRAPSGDWVYLADKLEIARDGTVAWPPEEDVPTTDHRRLTNFSVEKATTLEASRRLHLAGSNPVALNFASAYHPGGGYLGGARAQEESIARASGLVHCLEGQPFYEYHHKIGKPIYSSYALYSPGVPVFRAESGELLEEPWPLAVITCAAPNSGELKTSADAIEAEFGERIHRVLAIGAYHGHDAIVLGAWGCGAFRNDPKMVSRLFHEALDGEMREAFDHVVFAVTDSGSKRKSLAAFVDEFS